jgi:hypothetical protein
MEEQSRMKEIYIKLRNFWESNDSTSLERRRSSEYPSLFPGSHLAPGSAKENNSC